MGETGRKRDRGGLRPGQTNAGSFTAENPRPGPGRGKKKAVAEAGGAMAADMERAYTTAEEPGEPLGVKQARQQIRDDYPRFMAMYLKFKELAGEVEVDKAPGPVTAPEVAAAATPVVVGGTVGPKEESVVELAHRLLREWELKDGHEAAGGGGGGTAVQGG
jgi:hypothetical protein